MLLPSMIWGVEAFSPMLSALSQAHSGEMAGRVVLQHFEHVEGIDNDGWLEISSFPAVRKKMALNFGLSAL